jgi:peptidoglycan/LPS O-acetylase OafA/YrhL
MFSCVAAAAWVVAGWALILFWHARSGEIPGTLTNGLAYAGLAIMAMALIFRCAAKWHPALRRVFALLVCAAMAGVDTGLGGLHGEAGQKLFFSALLGIALVVLAARHAPAGLRRRWLGD